MESLPHIVETDDKEGYPLCKNSEDLREENELPILDLSISPFITEHEMFISKLSTDLFMSYERWDEIIYF